MLSIALVVLVVFLFLRNSGRDCDSERSWVPLSLTRNVRRDVSAGLQPE